MRTSRCINLLAITLVALLAGVALVEAPGMAYAASPPSAVSAPAVPSETDKITLRETSIDGPFVYLNHIAWTGTDPAHHLNDMVYQPTPTGWQFTNKRILGETSIARPAGVAVVPHEPTNLYFLAWTGTNQSHSLNVICDGCASSQIKLTLWNENSFAAPGIAWLNDKLMLAWTGTDSAHSLNALDISIVNGRFVVGQKEILSSLSSDFTSNAGPGLNSNADTSFTGGRNVLLSWSDRATGRIRAASSVLGATNWPRAGWSSNAETSTVTPSLIGIVPTVDAAHSYLAWTGTDPAHSLNILYPAYPPKISPTKLTMRETAFGGPSLEYQGGASLFLAWTGTDGLHHLNLAIMNV